MKRVLISLLIICATSVLGNARAAVNMFSADTVTADQFSLDTLAFTRAGYMLTAEQMPKFKGSDVNRFGRWLLARLRFRQPYGVQTEVKEEIFLVFVVGKDGTIGEFTVVSPHEILSREVERVVLSAPKWTPGMQDGEPVNVIIILPLNIRLVTIY